MKDDTISRAAALDFIDSMNWCDEISDEAFKKITIHLENLPSAQPGWIPCSERLPELNEDVLIFDRMGEIRISTFSKSEIDDTQFWWQDAYGYWDSLDSVIAWMPLPKPWEGGQE